MTKYVKIIYEDWTKEGNSYRSEIKDALVPFGEQNTLWTDSLSYAENFDALVQDGFDCGFMYISETKAITILQIKSFEHHNPQQQPKQQQQQNRKRANRRKTPRKKIPNDQEVKNDNPNRTDNNLVADRVLNNE